VGDPNDPQPQEGTLKVVSTESYSLVRIAGDNDGTVLLGGPG